MKKYLYFALAVSCISMFQVSCEKSSKKALKSLVNYELTSETYAFATNKEKGKAVLSAANELISQITSDGTLDKLVSSYFDGKSNFSYQNPSSKDGCLVVATSANFPPFEYTSGNKFTGIDIEIASLLAKKLGKTLYVEDMEFDSIIPSVQKNQADIAMAGLTVTEGRLQQVDFSTGYYTSSQVLTVKADNNEFDLCKSGSEIEALLMKKNKSFKIGTQAGTTGFMYSNGDEGFGYDGLPVTTKGYSTGALAMLDVQVGNIDAVILDKLPTILILKSMMK